MQEWTLDQLLSQQAVEVVDGDAKRQNNEFMQLNMNSIQNTAVLQTNISQEGTETMSCYKSIVPIIDVYL